MSDSKRKCYRCRDTGLVDSVTMSMDLCKRPCPECPAGDRVAGFTDWRSLASDLAEALEGAVALSREPRPATEEAAILLEMRQASWTLAVNAILSRYREALP